MYQALSAKDKAKWQEDVLDICSSMAGVLRKQGQLEKAVAYYRKSVVPPGISSIADVTTTTSDSNVDDYCDTSDELTSLLLRGRQFNKLQAYLRAEAELLGKMVSARPAVRCYAEDRDYASVLRTVAPILAGRNREALDSAEEYARAVGDTPDTARALAYAYLFNGQADRAEELCTKYKDADTSAGVKFRLTVSYGFGTLRRYGVSTPEMARIEKLLDTEPGGVDANAK